MANIWGKAISILAGDLNLGRSHLITTVLFANDNTRKNPFSFLTIHTQLHSSISASIY